jgi:hypothetical protein
MVLGGPVTKNIRQRVKLVFESDYCKDVEPEQGLVNYIFRGVFTQGLDSEFYMVHRSQGPAAYPAFLAVYNQDGLGWSPAEKISRSERQTVTPTEAQLRTLADGTELTDDELQKFARGLVVIVDWVSTPPCILRILRVGRRRPGRPTCTRWSTAWSSCVTSWPWQTTSCPERAR